MRRSRHNLLDLVVAQGQGIADFGRRGLFDAELHHGLEGAWLLGFGGWGADVYMGVYTERSLHTVSSS
jgi:hypothetical protein